MKKYDRLEMALCRVGIRAMPEEISSLGLILFGQEGEHFDCKYCRDRGYTIEILGTSHTWSRDC